MVDFPIAVMPRKMDATKPRLFSIGYQLAQNIVDDTGFPSWLDTDRNDRC